MSECFPEPNSSGGMKIKLGLMMQQKQIYKMHQVLIHQNLLKRLI